MRFGKRRFRSSTAVRSPLFGAVRGALRWARLANRAERLDPAELIGPRREALPTRRDFLRATAASALVLRSSPARGGEPFPTRQRGAPRIAIVGAGIAGLNAAYELKQAGLRATVYEASPRVGGRIVSARDLLAPGLVTELGGEFIDSGHEEMLRLVKAFGLELLDLANDPDHATLQETLFFEGRHYNHAQAVAAFRPLVARIERDLEGLEDEVDFEHVNRHALRLDRRSVAEYLDQIGASGWIRKLIEVAFVGEYGLDCDWLSALNLLLQVETDLASDHRSLYGESDERYKIKGGNHQVITALADRLEGQIVLEHRLEALGRAGESYRLTFQGPGGRTAEAEADFVVLAVPFSVLRHVSLRVDLPARKRQAIEQLGYGTNSKLVAGVRRRVWRDRGFLGSIFSDQPFQAAYDHSRLQKVDTFGLTFYLGGRAGVAAGSGTAEDQCRRLMVGLDPAFPGTAAALSGSFDRFAWPTAPFALGSYACYTPGQWTTLAGIEGRPVGRLYFAGEHCHFENAGFMDSAARSGRTVARMLKSRISGYC